MDLAQLGFEKNSDWSLNSVEGAKRHLHASSILGCLEVLMEEAVMEIAGDNASTSLLI
jgi:hypothetical protein